jgi:Polyketide cyclase / dehydrase and lipid transport
MPLTLHFALTKPPAVVYRYLTDMELFVSIHPVIVRAKPLGNNRYRIREKMPVLGLFSWPMSYTVSVYTPPELQRVQMTARIMGLIGIQLLFELSPHEHGTSLVETVHFTSRLPVKPLLNKVFRGVHTQLFHNLNAAL